MRDHLLEPSTLPIGARASRHTSSLSWHRLAAPLPRPGIQRQAKVCRVHQDAVRLRKSHKVKSYKKEVRNASIATWDCLPPFMFQAWHSQNLSGTRVLQEKGRHRTGSDTSELGVGHWEGIDRPKANISLFRTGGIIQCDESLFDSRPWGWLLPRVGLHRGTSSHAGTFLHMHQPRGIF